MVRLKPVKRAGKPQYPQKEVVLSHPELLDKLPERWRMSRQAVTAAGLLATMSFTLAACTPAHTAGVPTPPLVVSESDAMRFIKDAAGGLLSDARQNYITSDSTSPITYVQYVAAEKAFKEVTLTTSGNALGIGIYNTDKGVGFEYVNPFEGSENNAIGFEYTGRSIDHADNDSAWVLVVDREAQDNPDAEKQIQEQVKSFISWLTAEGIV